MTLMKYWLALSSMISDVFSNSVNIILLLACLILIYYLFFRKSVTYYENILPKLKMRDFTVTDLSQYNGLNSPYRLIAVNGNIFDVTKAGQNLYGEGAPYSNFAGRDASRALSRFCNDPDVFKDEYDDLTDLNSDEMGRLKEWELQFKEKYQFVGRLLRPGEPEHQYDDEEEEEISKEMKLAAMQRNKSNKA